MTSATATAGATTRAAIEAMVVKRCWTDEAFRRELLADPAAFFAKHTGLPVEQAPAIVVHEESGSDWHIVIPPKPAQADELSDEDLERVAGGTVDVVVVTILASAMATVATAGAASIGAVVSGVAADKIREW